MPYQGIPYGNAFLVQTPEIKQASDQLFAQQQQRRAYQQQEITKLDPIVNREFGKVRSVDISAFTNAYENYKNIAKRSLFDPQVQRDPNLRQQLEQQKGEALSNVFQIADQSQQHNEMAKNLMVAKRSPHAADIFADNSGEMIQKLMTTPYDKLNNVQLSDGKTYDLTNPDTYKYQHTIDANEIHKKAFGALQPVNYKETSTSPDGLTSTTQMYKFGASPDKYHDNYINELAKHPTGEREAASAMAQFTPDQLKSIDQQYYAPNPDKWNKTTGQPNPIPVEATTGSEADKYAAVMSKLQWLHADPVPEKPINTPVRGAIIAAHGAEQEKLLRLRQNFATAMENYKQSGRIGLMDKKKLDEVKDEQTRDRLASSHFEDAYKSDTESAGKHTLSIPTPSGTPIEGVEAHPVDAVKRALGKADKYIWSEDGKSIKTVNFQRAKDASGNMVVKPMADQTKTTEVPVTQLYQPLKNSIWGKSRVAVPLSAPKVPASASQGDLNHVGLH